MIMDGEDFIGRTKGEKAKHIYSQIRGYPIRFCSWVIPEYDFIQVGDAPLCKYCKAMALDKRKSWLGSIRKSLSELDEYSPPEANMEVKK